VGVEENKELVRRYYEAIDDRGDPSLIEEFVSPDYVDHTPAPGCGADREGLKQAFQHFLDAAPDGRHTVEDLFGEGDKVVARVRGYGTQTGELFGIPATGRYFEIEGIAIRRVEDGRIVEHWQVVDMASAFQQLGILPQPDAEVS
jgi:steroid delta-isomerase-like uncharacterized protein